MNICKNCKHCQFKNTLTPQKDEEYFCKARPLQKKQNPSFISGKPIPGYEHPIEYFYNHPFDRCIYYNRNGECELYERKTIL